MKRNCVIVSTKSLQKSSLGRLENLTDCRFLQLSEKSDLTAPNLFDFNPRFVFFLHWSDRIPREIHENFECVLFHMTDLPYGRGGTPLQNLILNGFNHTKLSAFKCTSEMDAGPVYLKKLLTLNGTAQEIYERATLLSEEMIVEIIQNRIQPIEQCGDAVLFERRKPSDSNLETISEPDMAYDFIRMLDAEGYPHAFIEFGDVVVRFRNARHTPSGIRADAYFEFNKSEEGSRTHFEDR